MPEPFDKDWQISILKKRIDELNQLVADLDAEVRELKGIVRGYEYRYLPQLVKWRMKQPNADQR